MLSNREMGAAKKVDEIQEARVCDGKPTELATFTVSDGKSKLNMRGATSVTGVFCIAGD